MSACVWVDAYVQYVRSLLLFPIHIQLVVLGRMPPPPRGDLNEGIWTGMLYTLSPAEISPHEHKVTDVTDLDTSLSVLSRRFGLLTIRVLPTSKDLLFNQQNFFLFCFLRPK